jgi:Lrp/AsnC family leucine-responsive transcriptional regulator
MLYVDQRRTSMLEALDRTDRRILNILQSDGGITNVELSRQVGLAPATTLDRVRKLRQNGFILGYVALVDSAMVEQSTVAFVAVSLTEHGAEKVDAFRAHIGSLPEVLECYHVSGENDFLLKIVARDIRTYEDFLLHRLTSIPFLGRIHTSFVLSTVKHDTRIPIDES